MLGVALAVRQLNEHFEQIGFSGANKQRVRARIVVPRSAAPTKIENIQKIGGDDVELVVDGSDYAEAYQIATEYAQSAQKARFIHPYDDEKTVEGQSTAGVALVKRLQERDGNPSDTAIIVPVGGGGLLAGIALALLEAYPNPNDRPTIVGAQLEGADSAAQSWYKPKAIEALRLEFVLPLEYYAAHLPLYPFFISVFALIFGYLNSMLIVNIFFTVLTSLLLFHLVKTFHLSSKALTLILVFLFLPRFFIVRSVGAPESLFMFMILASLFFFEKKQYFYAGILGALATMTKTPGILLFGAYGLVFLERIIQKKEFSFSWLWTGLIPLGLIAVFSLYAVQYHDFFAYFHTGGVVPMPYPFSVFHKIRPP